MHVGLVQSTDTQRWVSGMQSSQQVVSMRAQHLERPVMIEVQGLGLE